MGSLEVKDYMNFNLPYLAYPYAQSRLRNRSPREVNMKQFLPAGFGLASNSRIQEQEPANRHHDGTLNHCANDG